MKILGQQKPAMLLVVACLCFVFSVFTVIDKREQLRAQEKNKNQVRTTAVRLRDEWRNLQLEYATHTGYSEISAQAARLQMVTPQLEHETLFYLPQEEGDK